MNPNEKFLFETSFDREQLSNAAKAKAAEEAAAAEPPAPTFSEEELAAAKQAAFADGSAAGKAEAEAGIARQTAQQLTALAEKLETVSAALDGKVSESHQQTLLAAMTVVRKLFPRTNSLNGLSEVQAVVEECLERLRDEPRMVIRASEDQIDILKSQLDASIKRSGFSGKLVFLADDRLSPGDVRVEWADGGAERDQKALWQEIDQVIERTLVAAIEAGCGTQASAPADATENNAARPQASAEIAPLPQARTA